MGRRERDGGQDDHREAGVSRRGFVVGVVAAGAAATAPRTLRGRLAVSGVPGAAAGRAAASTCGSFSLVTSPASGGELTDAPSCLRVSGGPWATWERRCTRTGR